MLDARLHGMCSGHPSCIEMVHLCSGQLCLTAPASANNQIAAMTVPSLTTCYLCVAPQSGPTYQERQESGPVGGSRRQTLAHRNKRPRLFKILAQLSPTPHFGESICDFWPIQQHEAFCQGSDVQRRFSDAQRRPAQRRPATFQRRSATPSDAQRRFSDVQRRCRKNTKLPVFEVFALVSLFRAESGIWRCNSAQIGWSRAKTQI